MRTPRSGRSRSKTLIQAGLAVALVTLLMPTLQAASATRATRAAQAGPAGPEDACPVTYPFGRPATANLPFKTFPAGPRSTVILLDVYQPPAALRFTPVPALVLVHGGGWSGGCKSLLNEAAVHLAQSGFLVLAIDYRLSCTAADRPTPEEAPLCGWSFTTIDPLTGTSGAAIHDIQDAVAWTRSNASSFHRFDGSVVAAGASAGGTLIMEASGPLPAQDRRRADVLVSWSGLTEFGRTVAGRFTCDAASGGGNATQVCWATVIKYLGCDIRRGQPACEARYASASPVSLASSRFPPMFLANSDAELVALGDATDMHTRLMTLGVLDRLCVVRDTNLHGRAYLLTKPCNGGPPPPSGPSVLEDGTAFMRDNLPDP